MYEDLIVGIAALLMVVGIFILIGAIFVPRRTKRYRKCLTDLYVAGRIRQIAAKDNISFSDEFENYKKFIKNQKMEDWDLDVTIEEELKDKIIEAEKKEMEGVK